MPRTKTIPGYAVEDSADACEARRAAEIRHYLATGEYDLYHAAWPGNVFESGRAATADLVGALVAEVRSRSGRRERGREACVSLSGGELRRLASAQLEPMIRGLFPRAEQ